LEPVHASDDFQQLIRHVLANHHGGHHDGNHDRYAAHANQWAAAYYVADSQYGNPIATVAEHFRNAAYAIVTIVTITITITIIIIINTCKR
jgi:hypothetical protein